MKKLITMMAIVATSSVAMAQTEGFTKGSLFLSGNVGFSSQKTPMGTDDAKYNTFSFNPRVGYFISDKIALGVNLGYNSGKSENSDFDYAEIKSSVLSAGAFGRYYFTPANKFSMFMHLGVDYMSQKTEYNDPFDPTDGEFEFKSNGFGVNLAPGLHYFISNRLALETSVGLLGFSSTKPDVDGAEATTNFNFNLGLNNITFGLVYKLK